MAPTTHLLASWIIAAKTTSNPKDCRLVALAGILPDLDGAGLVVDLAARGLGYKTLFYEHYHHYLLHGAPGAVLIAVVLAAFAVQRWRVLVMAVLVFHLHLVCDYAGSRGPSPEDLWPIFYQGPFDRDPMWIWKGQWRLDSWVNRYFTVALFFWSLWIAARLRHLVVGVFNRRADAIFIEVLLRWKSRLKQLSGGMERSQADGDRQ